MKMIGVMVMDNMLVCGDAGVTTGKLRGKSAGFNPNANYCC